MQIVDAETMFAVFWKTMFVSILPQRRIKSSNNFVSAIYTSQRKGRAVLSLL